VTEVIAIVLGYAMVNFAMMWLFEREERKYLEREMLRYRGMWDEKVWLK